MKRIFALLAFIIPLLSNAQVFNHKEVLDKFDDVILSKNQKTLIEITDDKIIIEEKGNTPTEYAILTFSSEFNRGDADHIVNLVDDVYGYERSWPVVKSSEIVAFYEEFEKMVDLDEKEKLKASQAIVERFYHYITRRVITTQYSGTFIKELFWVADAKSGDRTIYSNE